MQNRRIITRERSLPPKLGVGMNAHWATLEVLDRERRVVKTVEASNVILDQGLDYVAEYTFPDLGKYCAVGTGVDTDDVEDTGLGNEIARTNRLPAGVGNVIDDQVVSGRFRTTRHFEFTAAEVEGEALTVVGFSPESSAGSNLVTKVLLPEPIEVPEGHSVRVKYAMDLVHNTTPVTFSVPISGLHTLTGKATWLGGTGSHLAMGGPALGYFDTFPFGGVNDFNNYPAEPLRGFHADEMRRGPWVTYEPYTPGSYERIIGGIASPLAPSGSNFGDLVENLVLLYASTWQADAVFWGMDFQSTPIEDAGANGYILKLNDMKVTWGRE